MRHDLALKGRLRCVYSNEFNDYCIKIKLKGFKPDNVRTVNR